MGSPNRRKKFNHVAQVSRHRCDYFDSLSTKGYLLLSTWDSFEPSMQHSDDWAAWRCIMQQLEAVWWCGWGQARDTHLLAYSRRASNFGVFGRAHLQIEPGPPSPFHCAAPFAEEGWDVCCNSHACTSCTQTGKPSSEGRHNLIVCSHRTLSEGSDDSVLIPFHSLDVLGFIAVQRAARPSSWDHPVCRTLDVSGIVFPSRSRHDDATWDMGICMIGRPPKLDKTMKSLPVRLVNCGSERDDNHTDDGQSCGEVTKATSARIDLDRMRP